MPNTKTLLRLASAIHHRLNLHAKPESVPQLPLGHFQRCERLGRLLAKSQKRDLHAATAECRRKLRLAIRQLYGELVQVEGHLEPGAEVKPVTTVREILADLLGLHDEFPQVKFDLRQQRLSVFTDPVELEGTYLGVFEIRLSWKNLVEGHPDNYRVVALDPHPAASNDSVTHPHVQDEVLCEGDGRTAIKAALREARLFDFFLLVRNVLLTYNPESPYVILPDWGGVECHDCGTTVNENQRSTCDKCEVSVCDDCYVTCNSCDGNFCCDCTGTCAGCEERNCDDCLKSCSSCDEFHCSSCLGSAEKCEECHEAETESAEPTEDPQVHAHCLGEAPVSPGPG